jgi:putative DNA primase/helicase
MSADGKNGAEVLVDVIYQRLSTVEARPIDWLWPGRIAKGKFSILVGNAGLGKSQICASLASIVSRGGFWPVDRTEAHLGSAVILSAEDDPEDTIRPRLEAAGADLDNIYIFHAIKGENENGEEFKRSFNLAADTVRLSALIQHINKEGPPVSLVIIDPLSAYLGNADSHNNAEVRALLSPLQTAAAQLKVAILGVSHLTKAQGMDALLRLQGSVAFGAAARVVWGITKDKDDPNRRLMLPLKNNLGTDTTGFAYCVESCVLEESDPIIGTSRIMWEKDKVTVSADEAFSQGAKDYAEHSTIEEAKNFLRDLLANGSIKTTLIEKEARGAGISQATLRRAKVDLKVKAVQDDFHGPWHWRLP